MVNYSRSSSSRVGIYTLKRYLVLPYLKHEIQTLKFNYSCILHKHTKTKTMYKFTQRLDGSFWLEQERLHPIPGYKHYFVTKNGDVVRQTIDGFKLIPQPTRQVQLEFDCFVSNNSNNKKLTKVYWHIDQLMRHTFT